MARRILSTTGHQGSKYRLIADDANSAYHVEVRDGHDAMGQERWRYWNSACPIDGILGEPLNALFSAALRGEYRRGGEDVRVALRQTESPKEPAK